MLDAWNALELEQQKEKIKIEVLSGISPVANPQAYLLAGQPGAGKSTMVKLFTCDQLGNIAFISGDDYRKEHPHYITLQAVYGDQAVLHTQEFAGKMAEALIDDLSQSSYQLIVEGTLRTADVPLQTCKLLKARGYTVSLNILLVRPEESYLSTLKRYKLMVNVGLTPRMTPKEHHDLVIQMIINNLHTIYLQDVFHTIRVYNRAGTCLYNQKETPFRDPSELFHEEFTRVLTNEEQIRMITDYAPYVGVEKIREIFRGYEGFFPSKQYNRGL